MISSLIQELPSFSNLIPSTPSSLLQTPPPPGGSLTNLPAAVGGTGANQQQQQATPTTLPIPGLPTGQAAQPSTPRTSVKQPSKELRLSVSSCSKNAILYSIRKSASRLMGNFTGFNFRG